MLSNLYGKHIEFWRLAFLISFNLSIFTFPYLSFLCSERSHKSTLEMTAISCSWRCVCNRHRAWGSSTLTNLRVCKAMIKVLRNRTVQPFNKYLNWGHEEVGRLLCVCVGGCCMCGVCVVSVCSFVILWHF